MREMGHRSESPKPSVSNSCCPVRREKENFSEVDLGGCQGRNLPSSKAVPVPQETATSSHGYCWNLGAMDGELSKIVALQTPKACVGARAAPAGEI